MPNYKILPMESHHALPGIEYEKTSSYLMLSSPARGEESESDWSLVRKRSQFLSVAVRRGKGRNQSTQARAGSTTALPLGLKFHSEQEMLFRPLPGAFVASPSCTFCTVSPRMGSFQQAPMIPYPTQVRGADQSLVCKLSASLTSLPLHYC